MVWRTAMARICSVCRHVERNAIDLALVGREPSRAIASRFGLSRAAVSRHRVAHLPATLSQAVTAAEVVKAESLLDRVQYLYAEALGVLSDAKARGDGRLAVLAIAQAARVIELQARVTGELDHPVPPVVPTILYTFKEPDWPAPLIDGAAETGSSTP